MKEQVSSTALTVLQGILYTAQDFRYSGLVSDEMKEGCFKILAATPEGQKRLRQLDSAWVRSLVPFIERLMMPGITLHYVLRKRYIEDVVRQAIADGCTQVVNVGAGFDTLASRLAKQHPQVNFIEIDHPATHQLKRKALMTSEGGTSLNLHLLSADLMTERLEQVLENAEFVKSDAPTVCILEGVLMYLDAKSVEQVFSSFAQCLNSGIRVAMTAVGPASSSDNSYGWLLKMYLAVVGESLNWTVKKTDIENFLNSLGYDLVVSADSKDFRRKYLPENDTSVLHNGEYIAVADYQWTKAR